MTTIKELEELAKAAKAEGHAVETLLGRDGTQDGLYAVSVANKDLIELCAVFRQMAEALEQTQDAIGRFTSGEDCTNADYSTVDNVIQALARAKEMMLCEVG